MRILHTSDWHLGQLLHDYDRGPEHDAFFSWLADRLDALAVDALLICGDVFDVASPSPAAQERWFGFLATTRARLPRLSIVAIGGNHDSAARLDAPGAILRALDVHLVGGLPRLAEGALDFDKLVVPVRGRDGTRAWVVAVPFLRMADVTSDANPDDPIAGVAAIYRAAIAHARTLKSEADPIVVMGHLYAVGGAISALSERRILGGNQHALPVEIFDPDAVAYVALGHLHLAQSIGGRDHVRYSGSPIPLAIDEARYRHQVVVVDLEVDRARSIEALSIPRAAQIVKIPARGAAPLADVLAAIDALPRAIEGDSHTDPYVEINVAIDAPAPLLAETIVAAIAGKKARLCKIGRVFAEGSREAVARSADATSTLDRWTPEDVLRARWSRTYPGAIRDDLLVAFHELLDAAERR